MSDIEREAEHILTAGKRAGFTAAEIIESILWWKGLRLYLVK